MVLVLSVLRCPDKAVPETRRVEGGDFTLGRADGCDWVLLDPDRMLSRRHCTFEFRAGNWQLRDLSANGTFVNAPGTPIGQNNAVALKDGDRLILGAYEIEARIEGAGASPGWSAAVGRGPEDDPFGSPFGAGSFTPAPTAATPYANPPAFPSGNAFGTPPSGPSGVSPFGASPGGDPLDFDLPSSFANPPPSTTPSYAPPPSFGGDPFADPNFDPLADLDFGAARGDHQPGTSDAFVPPRVTMPGALPDDWDQDPMLGGKPAAPGGFETGKEAPPPFAAPGADPFARPGTATPPASPEPGPGSFAPPPFTAPNTDPFARPGAPTPPAFPEPEPDPFAPAASPFTPAPPPGQDPLSDLPQVDFPAAETQPPPRVYPTPPPASAGPVNPFNEETDWAAAAQAVPQLAPAAAPPVMPVQAVAPPVASASAGGAEAALALVLQGAGLGPLPPGTDPATALLAAGAALRASVEGLRALLIARADVKRAFRIEQTMLNARANNPVKFAATDEVAIAALLTAPRGAQAVGETVADLNLHQVATLAATQAASRALLDRMAPAAVEEKAPGGGLLPGAREKKLWEAYRGLHAQLLEQFDDDFDSAFGKAFARAYEQAARQAGRPPISD